MAASLVLRRDEGSSTRILETGRSRDRPHPGAPALRPPFIAPVAPKCPVHFFFHFANTFGGGSSPATNVSEDGDVTRRHGGTGGGAAVIEELRRRTAEMMPDLIRELEALVRIP